MSQYKIEKGIPAPKLNTFGRVSNYPFADMEIGDSFKVDPAGGWEGKELLRKVKSAASSAGKKLSRKFIARSEDEGVRVWRIEDPDQG